MSLTPEERVLAIHEAWRVGQLRYKLLTRPKWLPVYDRIQKLGPSETFVIESGVRTGKSSLLITLCFEIALRNPGCTVGYVAPAKDALKKYLVPILADVLKDCPEDLRPSEYRSDNTVLLKNGSMIVFAGSNMQSYSRLRGFKLKFCGLDEARQVDDLGFVFDSVLKPRLFDLDGFAVMASTPPEDLTHPFISLADQAREDDLYAHFTVYDFYPEDQINLWKASYKDQEIWRREFLAERIRNSSKVIIPEFTRDIIKPYEKTKFYQVYHKYISADWGVRDKTVFLLGIYDFLEAKLYIQKELVFQGSEVRTDIMSVALKQVLTVRELNYPNLYRCPADNNNLQAIQDLNAAGHFNFYGVQKNSLVAMVNKVRLFVSQKRLMVDPSCVTLINDLEHGEWDDSSKTAFKRSKSSHVDALASLMYLLNDLDDLTNPIPNDLIYTQDFHIQPEEWTDTTNSTKDNLKRLFRKTHELKPISEQEFKPSSKPRWLD